MKNFKNLLNISGIISSVLLLFGAIDSIAQNNQVKEVHVAIQPFPLYAPIFVAKEKGWLEEELKKTGSSVKWSSFPSGPQVNESFAAGQQDLSLMGDTPALIARASGQNTRIIGNAAVSPSGLALIVPKDSTVKSVLELKGKRIALVKGSYAHHLLYVLLKVNGLNPGDVQIVSLPAADHQNALVRKDIDASVIWEPFITKLEDAGIAKVIADGTGVKRGNLVLIARHDFATANPEAVISFIKVYRRGHEYIKSNPEDAARLISPDIKLAPELLVKVFKKFNYDPSISPADISELKSVEEFMRAEKIIKNPVAIDSFIDSSYLKKAGGN